MTLALIVWEQLYISPRPHPFTYIKEILAISVATLALINQIFPHESFTLLRLDPHQQSVRTIDGGARLTFRLTTSKSQTTAVATVLFTLDGIRIHSVEYPELTLPKSSIDLLVNAQPLRQPITITQFPALITVDLNTDPQPAAPYRCLGSLSISATFDSLGATSKATARQKLDILIGNRA
jgi:hypothetical protein